jgi:hypothetical protein
MHGYKGFYNGKQSDIYADSLVDAKKQAIALFKVPKSKQHMVSVVLCEKDVQADGNGTQVIHPADF